MGDMRTVLIEGLFHFQDGNLVTDRGDKVVDSLVPFIGQEIQIAIHFIPSIPLDETKWGGGCCYWQPNPCPAGHHEHPDRLLNVAERGVLRHEDGKWSVDKFDGTQKEIPLALLDGHMGRVAAATIFDMEAMRDALKDITPEALETLGVRATNLRDMLAELKKHTGGI